MKNTSSGFIHTSICFCPRGPRALQTISLVGCRSAGPRQLLVAERTQVDLIGNVLPSSWRSEPKPGPAQLWHGAVTTIMANGNSSRRYPVSTMVTLEQASSAPTRFGGRLRLWCQVPQARVPSRRYRVLAGFGPAADALRLPPDLEIETDWRRCSIGRTVRRHVGREGFDTSGRDLEGELGVRPGGAGLHRATR